MTSAANAANNNNLPGHILKNWREHGEGYAICSCGASSDIILGSRDQREDWHHGHKDEIRQQMKEIVIEAPKPFPYMTIIQTRIPRQKAHENLGQTKKAVLFRLRNETLSTPVKVYKWTDSGWELMWDIQEGTPREGMPWVKA